MIAIWAITKRIPRGIALIFNFITIFLTIFLLLGCYNTSNNSTFLVRYQLNKSSPFYESIQASFSESTTTKGLEKVKIRSGYMGVCISNIPTNYSEKSSSKTSICYPRKNLTSTGLYSDLNVQLFNTASNSSSSLNILELAELTSVNVIHPYILMATIILTIIMFLCLVYVVIPGLPLKYQLNYFLLVLSSVLVLLSGMSAVWTHIGIHASSKLVPAASMNIVDVYTGRKAASMMWFGFSFLLIVCLILWSIKFRETRNNETMVNVQNTKPTMPYQQHYYSSDSSSYATKV